MKKTNVPSTSKEAYEKAKPMMSQHYEKIVAGMKKLGICNYEKIAANIGLDRHQVARRLKEMEGLQLVYKPGSKSLTSSGRNAFDYCLVGQGDGEVVKEVTYKSGEKSAADYASDLINNTIKPAYVQPDLFNP